MQNQIAKLNSKLQYLDNYAKTDPLSEKAIAYDRLIWAQASKSVVDGLLEDLLKQQAPDEAQWNRLIEAQIDAINRVSGAQRDWEQAGFQRARTELDDFLDAKAFKDQKDRDMIEIGGAVGRTYTEDDLGGVVPGDRSNVRHAPNLWVTKLSRVEYGDVGIDDDGKEQRQETELVPMFSSISHGVLDAFDLRNPEVRQQAGRNGAKEVLTTAIEINPDFKHRALEKRDQENQRPSKIVHVNINIPTSEVSRMLRDGREGDFIQHQFDAFAGLPDGQGRVLLSMTNDQDQIINSEFQLDTITFAFAASGDGKRSTQFDEHDRHNMLKHVGDLAPGSAPGGYIGGLVDRLRTEARRAAPEEKQKIEDLLLKIGEEVDIGADGIQQRPLQDRAGGPPCADPPRHGGGRHGR
jgi:hypothetical protein